MAAPGTSQSFIKPAPRTYAQTRTQTNAHTTYVSHQHDDTRTLAAIQVPEGWVFFGDHAKQNISSRYDHPNKTVLIAKDSDAYARPVDFINIWHQARGKYERS